MISVALQAEYFGFGISLDPARLDPVDKGPVEAAVRRVLTDPSFKVWPWKHEMLVSGLTLGHF